MDKSTGDVEPAPPLPIESTSFKLVEEVKDLKELAAKLRGVNEFAVKSISIFVTRYNH
jgi:exosome complex exonuclease RRP6